MAAVASAFDTQPCCHYLSSFKCYFHHISSIILINIDGQMTGKQKYIKIPEA
jgi:hypothetical protein